MGLMEQSLANATAYSFVFSGSFGNIGDTPANNATVDSVFVSGSAVNIRVYGPGGAGNSYTAWKRDQTSRTIPAATLTVVQETGAAPQVSTTYFVTYDFNIGAHNVWFNSNDYIQAVGRGQMKVGNVFTVNSSGTGGSGGGGTGGGGGFGGGNGGRIALP